MFVIVWETSLRILEASLSFPIFLRMVANSFPYNTNIPAINTDSAFPDSKLEAVWNDSPGVFCRYGGSGCSIPGIRTSGGSGCDTWIFPFLHFHDVRPEAADETPDFCSQFIRS